MKGRRILNTNAHKKREFGAPVEANQDSTRLPRQELLYFLEDWKTGCEQCAAPSCRLVCDSEMRANCAIAYEEIKKLVQFGWLGNIEAVKKEEQDVNAVVGE